MLNVTGAPRRKRLSWESRCEIVAFTTEDQKEGMAAFFEKRPPRFTGR